MYGKPPGEERSQNFYFSNKFCFSPWNRVELASSWFDFPNHRLRIWDITTGKATQQLRIENIVKSISYLTSARNILGCLSNSKNDSDTRIIASIWNTETGQMIERIQLQESSTCISLSIFSTPNKNIIAQFRDHADQENCGYERHVEIINIDTGSTVHVFTGHVEDIKFSPDGSLLTVHISWSTIAFYDTASGDNKWLFESSGVIYDFAFSPDGTLLAASTSEGIQILSIISSKCLRTIRLRSKCLAFSPDGQKIYSLYDQVINVVEMDPESFIVQDSLDDSLEKVSIEKWKVSLSPNCKLVASLSVRPTGIQLLDIDSNTSTNLLEYPHHEDDLTQLLLKFSSDSKKLVFVSTARVRLWDVSSKPARNILTQNNSSMFTFDYILDLCEFSPDNACLAIAFGYQDISVRPVYSSGHENYSEHLAYALRVQVWDTGSGKRLMFLEKKYCFLWPRFCFSRDSRRLAISYSDKNFSSRVEIWDIASVSAIQAIEFSQYYLHSHPHCSTLSPDFWSSPSFEDQMDEEAPEKAEEWEEEVKERRTESMKERAFSNNNVQFIGNDELILDLWHFSRGQGTGIRIILRTRTGLDFIGKTVDILRLEEVGPYELDSEKTWIEFSGKRLIWVPHRYRNDEWDTLGNYMVLSQNTGPHSIIQFRHSELIKQISLPHTAIIESLRCVPELDTDECLYEMGNNWIILHHDMGMPDNKTMCKIDNVGIKDITSKLSSARLKVKEKYSHYKRKMFSS